MKNIKKIVSVLLSFTILLSTIVMSFAISAETQTNYIVNGDFEEGKKGYLFADDENTNIKIYDNTDTARPGYGTITLDGKAAYIEGYGGNIAYAKKNNLQYKIENLPAGKYSVNMDVWLNNLNISAWATLSFGVTKEFDTTNGRAYSKPMITDSHMVTENGTSVTTATASNNTYHRVPGNSLTVGWHDLDVTVSFTITETTTVYLFVFCDGTPANSVMNATAYVDNISLTKEGQEEIRTPIVNGNFEEGKKGYLFADDENTNIEVYDNADTTRPGYGTVTLDGKAAYIEGYGGNIANAKKNNLQYKIVNLPAGKYSVSMDVWFNQIKELPASTWTLFFGVTDAFDTTNGRAYSKNIISNSVVVTENGTTVNAGTGKLNHYLAGDVLEAGWHDLDVTVSFTITETTTVYFFVFCNGSGAEDTMYGTAYVDNVKMNKISDSGSNNVPAIDVSDSITLTMDKDDFSKLHISSENQADANDMKIEIVNSGDSKYGNVLKLPSYKGTTTNDKIKSARFFTKYTGLTVGKTYVLNFDMKMPTFTQGSATQWLGLVGVSHQKPLIENAVTLPSSTMLPSKITTYTDKGTNTPISVGTFTNWSSAVFQWNNLGSEEWINYSINFVAEDTVAYFFIENYLAGISDFYVDNISVTLSDTQLDGKIKFEPKGNDKIVPEANSKNVLIIGNSFASHTLSAPLLNVINADEALLNIARYGKGAMSPGYFANQIINDRVNMEFSYAGKGNNSIYTCKGNISRDSVKNFADWDYIIVQAFTVGQSNTQNWSEVASLVNAVNTYLANANTKVLVWVPQSVSQSYCDANFGGANASTYKNYHDALATDLEKNISNGTIRANDIFNVNEMFWIARKHLGAEGVHVDGLHINSTGAYLMGLAIHKLVCGTEPTDFALKIHANNDIDKALKEAVNGVESSVNIGTIVNGNFEEGKKGYLFADDENTNIEVYDNADSTRPGYGTVTLDGKAAYIEGYGGNIAYAKKNNLQYSIVNLPAGKYSISMDVLMNHIDTSAWSPLAFGVTNSFDITNGRAYSKPIISDSAVVTENGTPVTIATSTNYHRVPGSSLTTGWHDLDVTVSFTITETTTVYFFVFCGGDGTEDTMDATAYIDNITLAEGSYVDTNFSFDFETGGTDGIVYRYSNAIYSHGLGLKRTDEVSKSGDYSLSSTAVSDESLSGTAVRGSFSLPINNLEKNKNYELNFWFKFKGADETLKSGFRVSKETASPEANSLVSTASQVNYSADIKFSDASHNVYMYGWAGFIALSNGNKGKDWVNVSVKFNTGDNSTVYLQFVNFAKKDTTFYIDDIKYAKYDGELPVQPIAKYDYENTIYEISFEEEVSNPLRINGTQCKHYVKSSKYAHTGKYSVEWDAYHDDGWENLAFTDKVGNAAYNPVLEPNTVYRYSCWIYAVGTGARDVKVAWNSPAQEKQTSQKMPNAAREWQQFVYTFSTGPEMTSCPIEIAVGISGLQYEGLKVYVDDIKLEKLVPSVLATNTSDNYCEDIVNQIDNGNFEDKLDGTIWDSKDIDIKLVKETKDSLAPSGLYYAHIDGDAALKVKIKLRAGYEYKFMYSYKAKQKNDFKIGILDDNGKELQPAYESGVEHTSLLVPKTDGEWHREGYTLFTPASGYVYFSISGKDADIYLDAISLYKSKLSREEDPNTYDDDITLNDLDSEENEDNSSSNQENSSDSLVQDDSVIGELDNDYNEEIYLDNIFDDNSQITDTEISEDSDDYSEWTEEVYVPGGRYKKIRKIYTTSWWVYALIIAGGVVAAGGITVLTVIIVKKKRKKNIQ